MDKSKWEYKKCNEVFDLFMGKTPSRKDSSLWNDGSHPWVSISDMTGKYISYTKETVTDKATPNMKEVPAYTAIMSFKLTIGRTAIARIPLYTNEAIMAFPVKPNFNIDSNFLYYYLPNVKWARSSNRAVMGFTLNKKNISDTIIAVPPISDQHHIVSELDQLSELISLKQQQIKEYDALAQSLFYEMFGDLDGIEKGYKSEKFGNCFKLKSGDSLTAKDIEKGEYPVYGGNGIIGYHKKYNIDGQHIIIGRVGALCGNVHFIDGKNFITDNAFVLTDLIGFDIIYLHFFVHAQFEVLCS